MRFNMSILICCDQFELDPPLKTDNEIHHRLLRKTLQLAYDYDSHSSNLNISHALRVCVQMNYLCIAFIFCLVPNSLWEQTNSNDN